MGIHLRQDAIIECVCDNCDLSLELHQSGGPDPYVPLAAQLAPYGWELDRKSWIEVCRLPRVFVWCHDCLTKPYELEADEPAVVAVG